MINYIKKINPNTTAVGIVTLSRTEYGEDNIIVAGFSTQLKVPLSCTNSFKSTTNDLENPIDIINHALDQQSQPNPDFVPIKQLRVVKNNLLCKVKQKEILSLDPDKLFYDIVMVNRKVINNISIEYSLRKEC